MKKITLVLLLLTSALIGKSQEFNKVIKSTYEVYDDGKWVTKQTEYPTGIYIILDGDEITINNNAHSKFKTYGDPEKSQENKSTFYTWKCVDDKGKDCVFIMTFVGSKLAIITFAYAKDNFAFMFFIDND